MLLLSLKIAVINNMKNVDVILNQWATIIQISILLVLVFVFYALWKNFPRRIVFTWMMAWLVNLIALVFIYLVLLGQNTFSNNVIKILYLCYAFFKITFAILLINGFLRYLMKHVIFSKKTILNGLFISIFIGLILMLSSLNTLHIQILVYLIVGIIFASISFYSLYKIESRSSLILKIVFLLEGLVFLHHAWVLIPTIWGEPIPSYMTHISFLDSISELIVGIVCLFAITNHVIDEITRSNLALEKAQFELRALVDVDPLTGLWNRRKLKSYVQKYHNEVTLIYIDVNDFKSINDTLGHHMGDLCLQKIASTLKQLSEKETGLFRLGGDEFLAVIPNKLQLNIDKFTNQLKHLLSQKSDTIPVIFIAIGIEVMNINSNFKEAIKQADMRMYQAKNMN